MPSREDLVLAHMGQHLLIADLAAPFLLIGLRSPVYAFYLPRPLLVSLARIERLRRAFRVLRKPMVAVPVWVVILYGWHFSFAFVGALEHPVLHVVQHLSFLFGAMLVWWSVIEPKRRRVPGELWKVPYLLGARLAGDAPGHVADPAALARLRGLLRRPGARARALPAHRPAGGGRDDDGPGPDRDAVRGGASSSTARPRSTTRPSGQRSLPR